jgi:uncharacterized membrane protein YbhN (UPF0104 family)
VVKKRVLVESLKYVLALGLLGYVVCSNWAAGSDSGLEYVWRKHARQGAPIRGDFLALAGVIFLASVLLAQLRWYVLVRAQGLAVTMPGVMRLGLIGFFFNTFLPGSLGGDVVKAAGLAREQNRRTAAVATVIIDRVIALWGLVWLVALVGGFLWAAGLLDEAAGAAEAARRVVTAAIALAAISTALWALLGLLPRRRPDHFEEHATPASNPPEWGACATEFWRALWMYRGRQRSIGAALLLSWAAQVGFVLTFYFSVRTLWSPPSPFESGATIPTLAEHFLLVPIGLVIQAVPVFPGGAGIGEAGFGALYSLFGGVAAWAVLGSLLQRVLAAGIGLVGLGLFLHARPSHRGQVLADSGDAPALAGNEPEGKGLTILCRERAACQAGLTVSPGCKRFCTGTAEGMPQRRSAQASEAIP